LFLSSGVGYGFYHPHPYIEDAFQVASAGFGGTLLRLTDLSKRRLALDGIEEA
jgi:hypothetical protein